MYDSGLDLAIYVTETEYDKFDLVCVSHIPTPIETKSTPSIVRHVYDRCKIC